MRGIDVTEKQMESARDFVLGRSRGAAAPKSDEQPVVLPFGQLVRLVAWYGAMRYQAGRDGINSLEDPGKCD